MIALPVAEPRGDHTPRQPNGIDTLCVLPKAHVAEKDRDVHDDQNIGHIGCAPRRVMISDWEHAAKLLDRAARVKMPASFPQIMSLVPHLTRP